MAPDAESKLQAAHTDGAYSGLLTGLRQTPKSLPCSYLYDATGSELYERITELDEYYPFRTEQAMLRQHAKDIVSYIVPGSVAVQMGCGRGTKTAAAAVGVSQITVIVVVELGCGSAAKTGILLNELLARDGPAGVRFAGVDCSAAALNMAKKALLSGCDGLDPGNVELVCAEYTEGIAECRQRFPRDELVVLWLGSSVGNLAPAEAVQFFRDMSAGAGSNIQVLLCADIWKQRDVLYAAYSDREGVTEAFIKNGVSHALGPLSPAAADPSAWDYEVDVNGTDHQVEMWLRARTDIGCIADGVSIAKGERVLVEVSRKFTPQKLAGLAYKSGLYIQAAWRSPLYSIQLLVSPAEALLRCWADTNAFFARIKDWSTHPIAVRHPFCFYYGHMASFAKLNILPDTPASDMDKMMSRGIDPDVADPSQCHSHPDVPDQWPDRQQLQQYVAATRQAILQQGGLEKAGSDSQVMRRVALVVEHERMHLETLCYMMAQKVKADFEAGPERPMTPRGSLSEKAPVFDDSRSMTDLVSIPGGEVQMGVPLDGSAGFVWDNEGPATGPPTQVAPFRVASSPVTIGDFYQFAVIARGYERPEFWAADDFQQFAGKGQILPATWSQPSSCSVFVHWSNGSSCGWRDVADEPVYCSLAEALAYCAYRGGSARIMTEPEYQRILDADTDHSVHKLRDGGWEWTSTVFGPFPGFQKMAEYPEYSTDFFDDGKDGAEAAKHYVLRGAADVTHPALRRDSFRNWYQRAYPYVFASFHMAFDN